MSDGRRYSAAECQEFFGVLVGRDYAVLLIVLAGALALGLAAGVYVVPDGWLPGDGFAAHADPDAAALAALRGQVEAQTDGTPYEITDEQPALLATVRDPDAGACLDLLVVAPEGKALVAPLGRPYPC